VIALSSIRQKINFPPTRANSSTVRAPGLYPGGYEFKSHFAYHSLHIGNHKRTPLMKALTSWQKFSDLTWIRTSISHPFISEAVGHVAYLHNHGPDKGWKWEIVDHLPVTQKYSSLEHAMNDCDAELTRLGYRLLDSKSAIML
jgi:hypothetical protein